MSTNDPGEPLPTTPVPPAAPQAAGAHQWSAPPPPWATQQQMPFPPQPPPRRDRAALAVVVFIFGGLFLIFFAFLWLAYGAVRGEAPRLASGPRIGVVDVKGPIGMGRGSVESEPVLKLLKRYGDDTDMKAIVVRIDSPGGAVATSQEILDGLRRLAEDKVVVCAMGNLAASGGLLVAMGCDRIVAEPGTLTGSIGVISTFPNVNGLLRKIDVQMNTVTAGKLKDAGSPFREFSDADRSYWQELANRIHRQFIQAVAEGRDLPVEQVEKFADGRVFTGEQAVELGLVDELGGFQDAVDLAKELAEIRGEPRLIYPPDERSRFLEELMGGMAQKVAQAVAEAVRTEIHRQSTSADGPGVYFLAQ